MLPFLFVLPAFLTIARIENTKYYITAFLIAIAISVGLSYLIWLGIIEPLQIGYGIDNPVPLMSHISYNPFLAFAFYLVVNKLLFGGKMPQLERTVYTFFALIMTFNMFITGGRAGQVMFFVAIIVLVFQYFKNSQVKAIIVSLILIPCIAVTAYFSSPLFQQRVNMVPDEIAHYNKGDNTGYYQNSSIRARITFLINTSELIKKSPVLGVGTGDFPAEYKKINNIRSQDVIPTVQPHNMYMLVLAQLGILGLASFAWIFYVQFKIALSSSNQFVRHVGVAMPIFFLIIMWSDSYLLGHYTGNLFILFSSIIYSNR
jgi:O-antigen ligase